MIYFKNYSMEWTLNQHPVKYKVTNSKESHWKVSGFGLIVISVPDN